MHDIVSKELSLSKRNTCVALAMKCESSKLYQIKEEVEGQITELCVSIYSQDYSVLPITGEVLLQIFICVHKVITISFKFMFSYLHLLFLFLPSYTCTSTPKKMLSSLS